MILWKKPKRYTVFKKQVVSIEDFISKSKVFLDIRLQNDVFPTKFAPIINILKQIQFSGIGDFFNSDISSSLDIIFICNLSVIDLYVLFFETFEDIFLK